MYSMFYTICFFILTSANCGGEFAQSHISRGSFVQQVNEAFAFETRTGNNFSDVDEEDPYYLDSMEAGWQGYLQPDENGNARLDGYLNRHDAIEMLNAITETGTPAEWEADMAKLVTKEEASNLISSAKASYVPIREDRILTFQSFDGYELTGRLSVPTGEDPIKKLVVFVNGSGVNTYENRVELLDYKYCFYDFFSDAFAESGTAFFSYNTRGVSVTSTAPYEAVNEEIYQTYLPHNQARDIETMVNGLRELENLADASVYLLGWSEGTVIAPLALTETELEVDGLLLAGYLNDNMKDVLLDYQLGGFDLVLYTQVYFDSASPDFVTKEEYEADPNDVIEDYLLGETFEEADLNKNGVLDKEDFYMLYDEERQNVLAAIERRDDAWLKDNYSSELRSGWLLEHFSLGKTEDILKQLSLPIYIFHGDLDRNCPVEGVYAVEKLFKDLGKTNLTAYIFNGHDHTLNYSDWIGEKKVSDGMGKLFEVVESLK